MQHHNIISESQTTNVQTVSSLFINCMRFGEKLLNLFMPQFPHDKMRTLYSPHMVDIYKALIIVYKKIGSFYSVKINNWRKCRAGGVFQWQDVQHVGGPGFSSQYLIKKRKYIYVALIADTYSTLSKDTTSLRQIKNTVYSKYVSIVSEFKATYIHV